MGVRRYLLGIFKNTKIRYKLLLANILVIALTATIVGFFSYRKSAEILEQQTINSTRQAFEQANNFISYKLNNVKDVSSYLYLDNELKNILSKGGEAYSLAEQINDYQKLMEILLSAQTAREIYNIRLYANNDALYVNSGNKILNAKNVADEEWYKRAIENKGSITWRSTYIYNLPGVDDNNSTRNIISVARAIMGEDPYGKPLGVVSVDILEENIYSIVKDVKFTTSGRVFLLDDEGVVISSDGKEPLGKNLSLEDYYSKVIAKGEGHSKYKINDEESIVYYKKLENTNWRLVAIIPTMEILSSSTVIFRDTLILMIIAMFFAAFIAYVVSGSLTGRIRSLIKTMRKIEDEKWDVKILVDGNDEIGVLQRSFKQMVDNIKELIEEKYEAELDKKNAELRALQAQINPHFLYNTLDMICWMSMKYGADDVVAMVNTLAKFFRLSLSGGKDIVTIRDEINHVRMYMDIQMKRFSQGLECSIDAPEEILDYSTVKLVLQPIVENAILHGIMESDSKTGHVAISGRKEGENIILTVSDNGRGMDEETLSTLTSEEISKGYGVRNVNKRIKLHYGTEYGLYYESEINKGTKVMIVFPAVPYAAAVKHK
ncbi:MAG: cache domain-containing protein [Clostridiaceae bacterium]